jgi:hypothetical protein
MLCTDATVSSASSEEISFMTPPVVHTNSMDAGDTHGEAMATPNDKANHTSTKRARE